MKQILILLGAVLALAVSCDSGTCSLCGEIAELRHVRLSLAGVSVRTRAENVTDDQESAVTECVLYVFNRDGQLVSRYESGSGTFDFYLTDETYDFVAVVNKRQLPDSPTRSELSGLATTLAENTVGHFVMAGSLADHVIQGDEKITVNVRRIVSKVTYTVRTAFTGLLAEKPFTVEAVYLTNVAGENNLGVTARPDGNAAWYNKMDRTGTAGAVDALLYGNLSASLAATDSIRSGHTFYPYPNSSADNHDKDAWSARCTRFVVKATLGGKTTYYPVTIPVTQRNKHYHIDLTISSYGVDHPEDDPKENSYVEAVISVSDWEDGGTIHEDY